MWKYISVHICVQVFPEGMVSFVTLLRAGRHRCSPVRQVLLTGSVNINKTSSLCANSCRGSAGSHANSGPTQTARKAGGQVSTAWPSLALGCLHSMNDKAQSAQETLCGIADEKLKKMECCNIYKTISEEEIYNEKMLLVLCVGKSASLFCL